MGERPARPVAPSMPATGWVGWRLSSLSDRSCDRSDREHASSDAGSVEGGRPACGRSVVGWLGRFGHLMPCSRVPMPILDQAYGQPSREPIHPVLLLRVEVQRTRPYEGAELLPSGDALCVAGSLPHFYTRQCLRPRTRTPPARPANVAQCARWLVTEFPKLRSLARRTTQAIAERQGPLASPRLDPATSPRCVNSPVHSNPAPVMCSLGDGAAEPRAVRS